MLNKNERKRMIHGLYFFRRFWIYVFLIMIVKNCKINNPHNASLFIAKHRTKWSDIEVTSDNLNEHQYAFSNSLQNWWRWLSYDYRHRLIVCNLAHSELKRLNPAIGSINSHWRIKNHKDRFSLRQSSWNEVLISSARLQS